MTIHDIYTLLSSRNFYTKNGMQRFRFKENALFIDRKALIPFFLYEENGAFYLDTDSVIAVENHLRIEPGSTDGNSFRFYGKTTGTEAFILE